MLALNKRLMLTLSKEDKDNKKGKLLPKFELLYKIFSIAATKKLPLLEGAKYSINLIKGKEPPFRPLYLTNNKEA